MGNFNNILNDIIKSKDTNVCIGLDLDPKRVPINDLLKFNQTIVDQTHDVAAAFKPNLSFYEALGMEGLRILESTIHFIKSNAPNTIIIGDAKRGDIGPSAEAYARALFDVWNFDAITVNPWGGAETIHPYLTDPQKGVFIWAKGSNKGSSDLQDVVVQQGGHPLYEQVVQIAVKLNRQDNIGLVVGATFPEQMVNIREKSPTMPFLIPGVGAQGGDLEAAVTPHLKSNSPFLINSSRGIIYADSDQSSFGSSARNAASTLKDQINTAKRPSN
ncbi:MAG: orotidine-5'-phosphate decarboxylase [SAR202 cluster bacterium]|nr:orotidine-5'-phosphate decarboxylase [SAR202 cluster bacterium]